MKKRIILISLIMILIKIVHAEETKEIGTVEVFQAWAETGVLCKDSAQDKTITDDNFVKQMQQLKFTVDMDVDKESGIYEGQVITDNIPVIFGFKLQKISFYQDSGKGFYAFVEASPKQLKQVVIDSKLDQYPIVNKQENVIYTFLTGKPVKENPYGIESKGIVISKTDQSSISRIGCQQFDY